MIGSTKRLERKQDERYGSDPEYQRYVQTVPVLIPLVPLYSLKRWRIALGSGHRAGCNVRREISDKRAERRCVACCGAAVWRRVRQVGHFLGTFGRIRVCLVVI